MRMKERMVRKAVQSVYFYRRCRLLFICYRFKGMSVDDFLGGGFLEGDDDDEVNKFMRRLCSPNLTMYNAGDGLCARE